MIEKLESIKGDDIARPFETIKQIIDKINELIEIVNKIQEEKKQ